MTREIKFGLFLPTGDFAKAKQAALDAEARGFYSVSIGVDQRSLLHSAGTAANAAA
jgi:hypothetical protein